MNFARELSENLAHLLRREHGALSAFLVALADFDRRRAWAELGYSSLFYYLHRELRLSKGSSQYRKVAAELIQAVPAVIEPLGDGRLCLMSVVEAAKVLTAENWETVLPRFYGLSRQEAADAAAALAPHPAPPARTVITRIAPPAARAATLPLEAGPAPAGAADVPAATAARAEEPARGSTVEPPGEPPRATARPAEIVPLAADRSRLHMTVSKEFLRKLEAATAVLSNARPGVTPEQILETGLDLLLAQAAKRRGEVERPQKKQRPSKPDHVPAAVRREVWKRDGGRCQWKLASGGICGCTRHLQLDHINPLALGGTSTVDNLRILCRAHNVEAARLVFGDAWMDRYTRRAVGPTQETRPRSLASYPGAPRADST